MVPARFAAVGGDAPCGEMCVLLTEVLRRCVWCMAGSLEDKGSWTTVMRWLLRSVK